MVKIHDYPCRYDSGSGLGLSDKDLDRFPFPDSYLKMEPMADLARAVRIGRGMAVSVLPFCHTLEAEALGANILPGNRRCTPRAGRPCLLSAEELFRLPALDLDTPRLRETLAACRLLKDRGEPVLFQISGPLTIFNSLLPTDLLFFTLQKQYDAMTKLFCRTGRDLIRLMEAALDSGADLISYADPMNSVGILGPKLTEKISRDFTAPFLSDANRALDREALILLCPKTALALTGSGLAEWTPHPLPSSCAYDRAALKLKGKVRFGGQACVKTRTVSDVFQELILRNITDQEEPI